MRQKRTCVCERRAATDRQTDSDGSEEGEQLAARGSGNSSYTRKPTMISFRALKCNVAMGTCITEIEQCCDEICAPNLIGLMAMRSTSYWLQVMWGDERNVETARGEAVCAFGVNCHDGHLHHRWPYETWKLSRGCCVVR